MSLVVTLFYVGDSLTMKTPNGTIRFIFDSVDDCSQWLTDFYTIKTSLLGEKEDPKKTNILKSSGSKIKDTVVKSKKEKNKKVKSKK